MDPNYYHDPVMPRAWPVSYILLDDVFNVRGRLRVHGPLWPVPPGDWDNDGRVETTVWCLEQYPHCVIAVVRLGQTENEVAALVHLDVQALLRAGRPQTGAQWQPSDPGAPPDLAFLIWPPKPSSGPTQFPSFGPPQTLAVLRWDKPGGVLVPVQLPDDGTVTVWTPPDGQPYRFGRDQNANEIFDQPPATQPAFAPAPTTSPNPQ
jgi:hypothetical protein